jgi:hypothetical protein
MRRRDAEYKFLQYTETNDAFGGKIGVYRSMAARTLVIHERLANGTLSDVPKSLS